MENSKVHDIMEVLFEHQAGRYSRWNSSAYMATFSALKSNLARVNFVYETLKEHNMFPPFVEDRKCDATALQHRQNGNKEHALGNYKAAMEHYTRSIATAETNDALALAFGNRSASLYRLELYQNCVEDIDRAFASGYPDRLKQKLIDRRMEASKLQKPTPSFFEEIPGIPDSQKNPLIQCASDCVKIEENKEFGRHIIATRDIQIGEILAVEKPYASVLTEDKLIHCHHCIELCYNPIPCDGCTQTLYCSIDCKKIALDAYHKYECPILLTIAELRTGLISLALKVAIKARDHCEEPNVAAFDKNEFYFSDRYEEIHNLEPATKKLSATDLYSKSAVAAIFFWLLETNSSFFSEGRNTENFKEILLLHVQSIRLNGTLISEYVPRLVHYEHNFYAACIYSFFSLFNHSCCHNVDRYFYGATMVIRAENTIRKGEQCFISYGFSYHTFPRIIRQQLTVSNYFFHCKCKACEEDWKPFLASVLEIIDVDMDSLLRNFVSTDHDVNKKLLPLLIRKLQLCERFEPFGHALILKKLIGNILDSFGNKRKI